MGDIEYRYTKTEGQTLDLLFDIITQINKGCFVGCNMQVEKFGDEYLVNHSIDIQLPLKANDG